MSSPLSVYLPCQVFPVLVRYGQEGDFTALESLILRAVQANEHSLDRLSYIFGITERMMLDALRRLWQEGHLNIDFQKSEVYLSQVTADLFAKNKLEKLALATADFDEDELMLDLVTGRVMPVDGITAPPTSASIIPYAPGAIKLDHVTSHAIVVALKSGHKGKELRDRGRKVWEASMAFRQVQGAPQVRWKKLEVTCSYEDQSRNTEDSRLEVTVLDTGGLSYGLRRDVGRHLMRVVEQGDDEHFISRLRSRVSSARIQFADVEFELSRLVKEARAAASCAPEEARGSHHSLCEIAKKVKEAVTEEIRGAASLEPVIGADAHEELIKRMLFTARKQVLIVCPSLSTEGLLRLRGPLMHALLGNKKRVIILWGLTRRARAEYTDSAGSQMTPYDQLKSGVKNLVRELKTQNPDRFFFSKRATGTNAKVVVCDNTAVLLSNLNVFDPPSDGGTQIGILARAPGDEDASVAKRRQDELKVLPLALDVLTWAREIVPDHEIASAIKAMEQDALPPPGPEMPEMPKDPPLSSHEEADVTGASVTVWAKEWVNYAESLERIWASHPSASLVRDGEHKRLLDKAVRTANRRLLVTSGRISPKVINATTLGLLHERAEERVPIRIVYRAPLQTEAGVEAEHRLQRFTGEAVKRGHNVQCIQAANRSQVLIYDNVAVVSSFKFLANSGQYPKDRASRSTDLGLKLVGPAVADAFAAAVVRAFRRLDELPSSVGLAQPAPATLDSEVSKVIKLIGSRGKAVEEKTLLKIFGRAPDPWRLLDEVAKLSLGESKIRRVAAACMTASGRDSDVGRYDYWLAVLARGALVSGSLMEAYLMLSALPDEEQILSDLPHLSLIELAATRRTANVEELLAEFNISQIPESQLPALAFMAVDEILQHGSSYATELIYRLKENHLPPAWKEAAEQVFGYLDQSYGQPFPYHLLTDDRERRRQEDELAATFGTLLKILEESSRKQFRFEAGTKTWVHLFHTSGLFGRLLTAARQRDVTSVRRWLTETEGQAARDILREASKEALGDDDQAIEFKKKVSLEANISKIIQAAKVVGHHGSLVPQDDTEGLVRAARQLSNSLKRLHDQLATEAREVTDEFTFPLVADALGNIEHIARHGTS
jgi:hypothetical protein